MPKKILILIECCILLLSLTGCREKPSTGSATAKPPDPVNETSPVQFEGVRSASNTSVELYFSGSVSAAALHASRYQIYGPQRCNEKDWHAQLTVRKVELSKNAAVVTLTTDPQIGATYQFVLNGIADLHGNLVMDAPGQDTPAHFTGTASAQAAQSDVDGVSDSDEQVGWVVRTVSLNKNSSCRDVNSDPTTADTDGDGVTDDLEQSYATDPRSPDTDGDSLSDQAEVFEYFSNPLAADTDEDGISDGIEATSLFTSPILADTDGDGMNDFQEVASGGTSPRLADLPDLSLDLHGNPSIIVNMTLVQTSAKVTIETTLEQEKEEQVDTDSSSTKMSIENTVKLHTEAEVGTSQWPPSASAKLTTDTEFKHGYFHETSSSWTNNSVSKSQQKYESQVKEDAITSYDGGMLWAPMKISNHSTLTFKIKDLSVIAYRMLTNGSFSAVGTLKPGEKSNENGKDTWVTQPLCPDPADPTTCGNILAPGGEVVLVMGADSLPAQEMQALVRDPSALMFEIGSYSLFQLDDFGLNEVVNYAKLGESVAQRTGTLLIDYGDGTVNRYMVATNAQRNPDGSAKGLTLPDALKNVVGMTDYELCQDGKSICRMKNAFTFRCDTETLPDGFSADFCPPETRPLVQEAASEMALPEVNSTTVLKAYIPKGFWMVAGTGPQFDSAAGLDFNSIRLQNGESINLVYMLDSDGDGIYDREEYLLGSDKNNPDTDDDGLDDYEETKQGWTVSVVGQPDYKVYSDPRFQDVDQDFLSDFTEYYQYTDPYRKDTDQDGLSDSIDPYPTTPPCIDPSYLSMTAWWNGANDKSNINKALDIMAVEPYTGILSDGVIVGSGAAAADNVIVKQNWKLAIGLLSDSGEQVFRLNLGNQSQKVQSIEVKDDSNNHTSISPNRDFSVSGWAYWVGVAAGANEAVILSKGDPQTATYSLSVLPDGKIQFKIYRSVHEKRWYCWLGTDSTCSDNSAADGDYNEQVVLTSTKSIPTNAWTHIMATFGGESMKIYANGAIIGEKSITRTWWSGLFKKRTTTTSLASNQNPLIIGIWASDKPHAPYRGTLDDIQIFTRMLQADEIDQLYHLGACKP